MRILFVGIASSIHAARWIKQLAGQGWDLHFFNGAPQWGTELHPECPPLTQHGVFGTSLPRRLGRRLSTNRLIRPIHHRLYSPARILAKTIAKIQPDIIHSLAIQQGGYVTLEALRLLKGKRPPWIVTNYGSDIYLFGKMAPHVEQIRSVLQECDYYSCETVRDIHLAREFDFRGEVLGPTFPNAGGYDLNEVQPIRSTPPSQRRVISIKGYQHMYGRAFVAMRAIERCADVLKDYTVRIYSPSSSDVSDVANLIANRTGLRIWTTAFTNKHKHILRLHGESRASISLSISDGACTSFLEALMMGSFPIQSCTAAAEEWIDNGRTGAIVHPDDPDSIEAALRLALSNDRLVDEAAKENWETARLRLDNNKLKPLAIGWYEWIASGERCVAKPISFQSPQPDLPPSKAVEARRSASVRVQLETAQK